MSPTQALNLATDRHHPAHSLKLAWTALLHESPGLRIREAAQKLGVSEAQLLALDCGNGITRLRPEWGEILKSMPALGRIMALTRNESAVHERYGNFEQVEINGRMGLVLGPDIDLRLFLGQWRHGFAATQTLHSGTRSSLQFFDAQGMAVHKIYLTPDSNQDAYAQLVKYMQADDQSPVLATQALPASPPARADDQVDRGGLRQAWLGLRDTHDFFGLLRQFDVTRTQAMRLVGEDLACPVKPEALRGVLGRASDQQLPVMVFVGNRGCIQIHTGPVQNLKSMGPWFNVLDPEFNLHLREDHIASAWVVRKPTDDGIVTSLELFDAQGETIALLFGKRKPGIPESTDWRKLVDTLQDTGASQ